MLITIRVLQIVDGNAVIAGQPQRDLIVARGYMPSGQELITTETKPASERRNAIRQLVEWVFKHRPQWSVAIDDSHGSTAVLS